MGQPIVVTEKPSSRPGVVRFETNRALTGMGHERYLAGTEVWGDRPPDVLARRLFERPSVAGVQINSNVVTVDLAKGFDAHGLREVVENLYIFYPDAPEAEGALIDADTEGVDSPESLAEPAEATVETLDDAPDAHVDEAQPTAANPAVASEPS